MKSRVAISVFIATVLVGAFFCTKNAFRKTCGVCGAAVVKVSSITDDITKPSKNISVWNRSICGNPMFSGDSMICTECWHAYSEFNEKWNCALENPKGFHQPLHKSIVGLPVPAEDKRTSIVVYSQEYDGTTFEESIALWTYDDEEYLSVIREYSKNNSLTLSIKKVDYEGMKENQIIVTASHAYTKR